MDNTKSISELNKADYNPRTISKHDFDALVESVKRFGDLSGVVRNTRTNELVGGHQRLEAFKKLSAQDIHITQRLEEPTAQGTVAYGYILLPNGEQFSYREVDWPLEFEKAANVAANRIQGEFNLEMLAELNHELSKLENGQDLLALTGQTNEEISQLLDSANNDDTTLTDEDEAPEVDEVAEPVSVLGKVYQLGPHRLMCGDSTSDPHVGLLMNGTIANMVFTDPPYNIAYAGAGGSRRTDTIANDKMSASDFTKFLDAVCELLHKYNEGAEYICMSSAELDTLKQSFVRTGGHFQNYIIWVKNQFTIGGSDYQHKYEPIVYGWPKRIVNHYYVGHRDVANVWEGFEDNKNVSFDGEYTTITVGDNQVRVLGKVTGEVLNSKVKGDIWRFDKPARSDEHPTMKPIALCEEAILNSSLRGGAVLDLFGGSGSTLIAADRLGRTCYMMELDPKYVDVIRKRYWKHINNGDETGWQENTPEIIVSE